MTLERYNQVLWAVLGSLGLLGGLGLVFWFIVSQRSGDLGSTIVLDQSSGKGNQALVFCEPIVIRGAGRHLIPVAAINVEDPESKNTVLYKYPRSYYSSSNCGLQEHGGHSRIFNVVVRDTQNERQWLLLDRPAQIDAVVVPSERCAQGEGAVPCGFVQWHIRDRDTNNDRLINNNDALTVFYSDEKVARLIPLTSHDTSLVGFVWDKDRNAMLYELRMDSNSDARFEKDDGTSVMEYVVGKSGAAQPIVDENTHKELLSRIGSMKGK